MANIQLRVWAEFAELPEAVYESGRSTIVLRMPEEPAERFAALVAAAELILKVASQPRES